MARKILAVVLASIMVFSFTACDGTGDVTPTSNDNGSANAKWEYIWVSVGTVEEYIDVGDGRISLPGSDGALCIQKFNELGAEGWELVSHTTSYTTGNYEGAVSYRGAYVFKRRIG